MYNFADDNSLSAIAKTVAELKKYFTVLVGSCYQLVQELQNDS